jgi:hypothetical protein
MLAVVEHHQQGLGLPVIGADGGPRTGRLLAEAAYKGQRLWHQGGGGQCFEAYAE